MLVGVVRRPVGDAAGPARVDQDVDAAEALPHPGNERRDVGHRGDVAVDVEHVHASIAYGCSGLLALEDELVART